MSTGSVAALRDGRSQPLSMQGMRKEEKRQNAGVSFDAPVPRHKSQALYLLEHLCGAWKGWPEYATKMCKQSCRVSSHAYSFLYFHRFPIFTHPSFPGASFRSYRQVATALHLEEQQHKSSTSPSPQPRQQQQRQQNKGAAPSQPSRLGGASAFNNCTAPKQGKKLRVRRGGGGSGEEAIQEDVEGNRSKKRTRSSMMWGHELQCSAGTIIPGVKCADPGDTNTTM
jgi:hypothetical protein